MSEFKGYHPIVNFTYFVFSIVFTCVFLHPVALAISLASAFTYSIMLKGIGVIRKNLLYMLPTMFLMALVNPVFNHQGATILAYFPNGNPLTLESAYYGFVSALMIVSVLLYFSCFNEVMTSDKLIYLFGKVIPSLSLVFSMVLRFVPRFGKQLKIVVQSQRCVGRDVSNGGMIKRAKSGLAILSIMVTWSLENAIETSDSMKSRGYGLPGRTAFSIFTFTKRDVKALVGIIILAVYVTVGGVLGELRFACFPNIEVAKFSVCGFSVFSAYLALMAMPVLIELWEVKKWKSIKSKI